jgi:hypothetical protein
LPTDPQARAWVRGIALINAADSHPLIVPRVRHYLTDVLKVSDEQRRQLPERLFQSVRIGSSPIFSSTVIRPRL